jgi:hypothetical protein
VFTFTAVHARERPQTTHNKLFNILATDKLPPPFLLFQIVQGKCVKACASDKNKPGCPGFEYCFSLSLGFIYPKLTEIFL